MRGSKHYSNAFQCLPAIFINTDFIYVEKKKTGVMHTVLLHLDSTATLNFRLDSVQFTETKTTLQEKISE